MKVCDQLIYKFLTSYHMFIPYESTDWGFRCGYKHGKGKVFMRQRIMFCEKFLGKKKNFILHIKQELR